MLCAGSGVRESDVIQKMPVDVIDVVYWFSCGSPSVRSADGGLEGVD